MGEFKEEALRLPAKDVFREYKFVEGSVPYLKKHLIYDLSCTPAGTTFPSLVRYIMYLHNIHKHSTVMKCSRLIFRMEWLKQRFGNINIYVVRNPRDQFESMCSFSSNYFLIIMLLQLSRLENIQYATVSQYFKKDLDKIGYFYSKEVCEEIYHYNQLLGVFTAEKLYQMFLILWVLSLAEAVNHASVIIDIDNLTTEKEYKNLIKEVMEEALGLSPISFDDCSTPQRTKEILESKTYKTIEDMVCTALNEWFAKYTEKSRWGDVIERLVNDCKLVLWEMLTN